MTLCYDSARCRPQGATAQDLYDKMTGQVVKCSHVRWWNFSSRESHLRPYADRIKLLYICTPQSTSCCCVRQRGDWDCQIIPKAPSHAPYVSASPINTRSITLSVNIQCSLYIVPLVPASACDAGPLPCLSNDSSSATQSMSCTKSAPVRAVNAVSCSPAALRAT